MTDRPTPSEDEISTRLRELALIDRIFGLEARLAQVSTFLTPTRERVEELEGEVARLRAQLDAVHMTANWRVGRLVLAVPRKLLPGRNS